jgi:PBSX family phage portal protein
MPKTRQRQKPTIVKTERKTTFTAEEASVILSDVQRQLNYYMASKDPVYTSLKSFESNQIKDPFEGQYYSIGLGEGESTIIEPPFSFSSLQKIPNENNIVKQCIDAMVTNIECTGYSLEYVGPDKQNESELAKKERSRIEEILEQPNADQNLIEVRKQLRTDLETFGNCFLEVVRNPAGEISALYHISCATMRVCKQEEESRLVEQKVLRNGEYVSIKRYKRFRRFVQKVGSKKVYFKEFGDDRDILWKTGQFSEQSRDGEASNESDLANEIIWFKIYAPGELYGLPRYINQLPAIKGSREAELVNLQFFKDNAVPALALLINGGTLTASAVNNLKEYLYAKVGREAINKILILEAKGDIEGASDDGKINRPEMSLQPLGQSRQSDELFQEYDDNNRKKVQSSFKLPDILIGRSSDYNRATSKEAIIMAEAQVFSPERNSIDEIINKKILLDESNTPTRFWKVKSNPTRVVSPDQVSALVKTLDSVGGMTPNKAIELSNQFFGLEMDILNEEWGDYPFEIAKELAKKGELKGIDKLTEDVDEEEPETENPEDNLDEEDNEE